METKVRFTYEKIRFDEVKNAHLVISMKAPKLDWESKRPRVCVIPIIDVSGSMAGEKLEYAKRTLLKLVDHLQPGDMAGLGAFSTEIYEIQPPVEMTQAWKDTFKTKIGELKPVADTCFSGGLELGVRWAQSLDLSAGTLVRVIALTDGLANKGVTSKEGLLEIVKNRGRATVSCFGYGTDANQALLSDLARAGEGSYAFIRNPEEALTAFGKELGGLLSTYAQGITIEVAPHGAHEIVEVLSDLDVEEPSAKVVRVKVGDILSEEERHVVLKVRLAEQSQALPREMSAFDVRVDYDVLEAGKRVKRQEELKAKIRFVKPGEEQEKPTTEVDAIVGLAELAKVQVEAEVQAKAGNYVAAASLFAGAGQNFSSRGLEGVASFAGNVGARYASSGVYRKSEGYRSSSSGAARRAGAVANFDRDALMDFGSSGLSPVENEAQAAVAASFASPGGCATTEVVPPLPPPSAKAGEKEKLKKGVSKSKSGRW